MLKKSVISSHSPVQPLQYVLVVNRLEDAQNHPTVLKNLGIRKLLGKGNEKEAIPKPEDAMHTLPYPQHKHKAIACPGTVRSKTITFWNEINLK